MVSCTVNLGGLRDRRFAVVSPVQKLVLVFGWLLSLVTYGCFLSGPQNGGFPFRFCFEHTRRKGTF